jgi:hypothetical protein
MKGPKKEAIETVRYPEERTVNGRPTLEYNSLTATLPVRGGRGGYQLYRTGDATLTSDNHDMMS